MNPRDAEFTHDGEVIATWWRQNTPGTFYWRNLIPARHLPGQVLALKTSDLQQSGVVGGSDVDVWFPRQRGAAIWTFSANATRGRLMAAQQELGFRVLLEVDDNYLLPADTMNRREWQVDFDRTADDKHSVAAHARIAEWVDGIVVSTEHLADVYAAVNANVYLCPNSVDPVDWPDPVKNDDGVLRIGWAASHSHIVDAPLIAKALRWAARQENVEVLVYGIGDVFEFGSGVKKVRWTDDLTRYRESLARCDVHVCPLYESKWSKGKSDIKAVEAAMAGAWPIVSSATPYTPWRERTTVCSTEKDWEQALKWVVQHRDEVPALAAEAKAYVLADRTIDKSIGAWREAIAA